MATKTNTSAQHTFHRRDAKDAYRVAIFEMDEATLEPGVTRITLPERSTWSPGLHWHEQHVEYFKVIKGRVWISLNGKLKKVAPEDGPQRVDRYMIHDFWRADRDLPDDQKDFGDVVTEEWTDPRDGIKHVFFRNLFSVLQDEAYWGSWTYWQALTVAAAYDDFIVVFSGRLSWIITHALYAGVRTSAKVAGLRAWYDEYTPQELRSIASGASKLE